MTEPKKRSTADFGSSHHFAPSSRFEQDEQSRAVEIADARQEAHAKEIGEFGSPKWVTDVNGEHGYDPSKVTRPRRFFFAACVFLSLLYPLFEYLAYHGLSTRIERLETRCLGG